MCFESAPSQLCGNYSYLLTRRTLLNLNRKELLNE